MDNNKMTPKQALPKPEDALAYLINRLVPPTSADAASNTSRSIESLRQALSAPRVPAGWREFVREVVESAEGYESRSGNKVNGNWVERGRALLTASPEPVAPGQESVAEESYWAIADILEPHICRAGKDGFLPASIVESVDILLGKYLASKAQVSEIADLRAEVEALKETRVMVPYLKNHADAVDGHYCIARLHPHGYHEFWNKEQKEWCSAGSVFELGKIDPDAARQREGCEEQLTARQRDRRE